MSQHEISMSRPSCGEGGRTGDWRSARPTVRPELCLAAKADRLVCQICWAHCPDACITKGTPPLVSLEYCKGCGICAEMCPSSAIEMVPERGHGACAFLEGDV